MPLPARTYQRPKLQIRVGVNLGPSARQGHQRPAQHHRRRINVAARVMEFAEPGQILVSRSYYDVMARLSRLRENCFHYEGAKTHKHVREHRGLRDQLGAEQSGGATVPPYRNTTSAFPSLHIPKF